MKSLVLSFFGPVLLLSCNHAGPALGEDHRRAATEIRQPKDSLIALLPAMDADTLDCTADVYWKIIKRGKEAIPALIESLTDTTPTTVYNHCKHGRLNVGELCYFALKEIADFPAFTVTHIEFDIIDSTGCWSFFDFLFDNRNKARYRDLARTFYRTSKFAYRKFEKKELNACRTAYHIEGKLVLAEQ